MIIRARWGIRVHVSKTGEPPRAGDASGYCMEDDLSLHLNCVPSRRLWPATSLVAALGSDCITWTATDTGAEVRESRPMHADGQQPHILCINHAPEILALMETLLGEEGFRVTTRSRLDKDLDAVAELAPNAIIIDYMWRQSDDEWVFLTLLTMDPRTRHIPLILCTGAVREARELQEHLNEMGIRVVLKPFDINHLVRVVQDAVGTGPGTDTPVISTLD